ncbi:MAG TPA: VOC family protein [Caulobacteraceae bacterium]|jgi:predicted enzyme related to lactoylglutathione lyase|nr:VOC family protein [Caulobacteraceae bacterium]
MKTPNTLIFVDLAADDPAAAGRFYAEVFGWRDDDRPYGLFHRMVPGGNFINPDGSESQIGNLHLGIFKAANARPHPKPDGVNPRHVAQDGRKPRVWILVGDGQNADDLMARALERGATELWRNHFWKEFNGFNHAFRDPWGNEIILWVKGGTDPKVPPNYTHE